MSKTNAKKTYKNNIKILKVLFLSELVSILLIFVRLDYSVILELIFCYLIYRLSIPKMSNKNLIDDVRSLDERGLVALLFDFVYVNWIVRALCFISNKFCFFYLLIAFCIAYEIKMIFYNTNKRN